jgi:ParB-like chromosome segregation protein Spo0J
MAINRKKKSAEQAWPADHVERRPVSSLTPYARNARTHTEAQVAQIAASIREWGWTIPVLIDETGMLIAGHARVMAAQQLGLPDVPVMIATGWSEPQKQAYVLADNKLALNAGWDADMLRVELVDLKGGGADLEMLGFTAHELKKMLAEPEELNGDSGLDSGLQYQIIIDCTDEQDQAETLARLQGDGRICRPLTL